MNILNSNEKKCLIITFLVLGGFFLYIHPEKMTLANQETIGVNYKTPVLKALTSHGAISITSDSDPDLAEFPGDGSLGNPYRIENFRIEVGDLIGIEIVSTSHHFILNNCYIDALSIGINIQQRLVSGNTTIENCIITGNNLYGIYLKEDPFTFIKNNTIHDNKEYGIQVYLSNGTRVHDNKLYNNGGESIKVVDTYNYEVAFNECWNNKANSIYIWLAHFGYVFNNTIYDCKNHDGIYLDWCSGVEVYYNYVINVSFGIYLDNSNLVVVVFNEVHETEYGGIIALGCWGGIFNSNIISDCGTYGMDITDCDNAEIRFNVFTNDGLLISEDNIADYRNYLVGDNTANGKIIGYFYDLVSVTFSVPMYGQLILLNCVDVTVSYQEFYNTDIGLYLWKCNDTLVQECTMMYDFLGMFIYQCNYTFTEYNCIEHNVARAIDIIMSNQTFVIYSDLNYNEGGVSAYYSPFTTINNNDILINDLDGVFLSECPYSKVMSNVLVENGLVGLDGSIYNGISMERSSYSNVTYNLLTFNGIRIQELTIKDYRTYNLSTNTVNDLPYGFFIDQSNFGVSGETYGQVFLVNCSLFSVQDMTFDYASNGLILEYCNVAAVENIHSTNGNYGIGVMHSNDIEVILSYLSHNFLGLWVENCTYMYIHQNECFHNVFDGCTLHDVDNSTISENRFAFNENHGVQLAYGEFNEFVLNLFQQNMFYGLKLGESDDNLIHHNTFFENNLLGYDNGTVTGYAQGYDTKLTNLWYDDTINEGNWWSDWGGVGTYILDGGPNNEDLYPLGDPTVEIISEFTPEIFVFLFITAIPVILISYRKRKR